MATSTSWRLVTGYHPDPNKRVRAADYADALQYLCLGAGLGVVTLTGKDELAKKVPRRKRRFSLRRRG